MSDALLFTTVTIIDDNTCRSTYNSTRLRFRDDMLCAGHTPGGQGSCQVRFQFQYLLQSSSRTVTHQLIGFWIEKIMLCKANAVS